MRRASWVHRLLLGLLLLSLVAPSRVNAGTSSPPPVDAPRGPVNQSAPDDRYPGPPQLPREGVEREGDPADRDDEFYRKRTAGDPSVGFTLADAAQRRAQAAQAIRGQRAQQRPSGAKAFGGLWTNVGPNPIVQVPFSEPIFQAVSGRVSALAIRSTPPYTITLGAAQGGIWQGTINTATNTITWVPRTDQLPSLAIGAVALAPANEDVIYVGTGEGNLSGDSYYGNGVLRSTDGGATFTQVSGTTFNQVSISKVVVDPTNPNHLYVATIRGRAGARRVTPPNPTPYGIYESVDGGVSWTARLTTTNELRGATDLVMDPLAPNILFASFWGQDIQRSTDGGLTWTPVMNGLPSNADYTAAPTRFALAIAHPATAISPTLYAGFEWYDTDGNYHPSTVWKSTDAGASWFETNTAVVAGYCGLSPSLTQCYYDNVLAVDPNHPDVVFAGGVYGYNGSPPTGGIFRSLDGGLSWRDLGWDQHPDFHAITVNPGLTGNVIIGNDGGVWGSFDYGGRLSATDPITAVTWIDLNGTVDAGTGAVTSRTGLAITQFTSVGQSPYVTQTNRIYGGTQDNGMLRRTLTSDTWFDQAGGDGGQVLVDPVNPNFVYGTYFGLTPYRFSDAAVGIFTNQFIQNGINTNDRSEFYVPFAMDPEVTSRLYIGSFRLYRTDNRGDLWKPISPDLTSGCTGTAPNGARGCVLSAIGVTAGAPAVYTGSADGLLYLTTDATIAAPVWTRIDKYPLPPRPVAWIEVDRSNYRVAYVAYNGFNAATPTRPGHVFKTTDAGVTWTNVSGNLPDVPVNSLILDPTDPNTLYVGTDVGPMVTTDGGTSWAPLGTGFPVVTIWQMNLNPRTRQMVAATHGRGAWRLDDSATARPALQVRTSDAGLPVGPGSLLTYTLTLKNIGNFTATNVTILDPVPNRTTFVSADSGGTLVGGTDVVWNGLTVPVDGSIQVRFTVQVATTGVTTGSVITNDGVTVTSAEGARATGSPYSVTLAPPAAVSLTPASQADGTRAGQVITYTLTVQNNAFNSDSYALSASGNAWPTSFFDATCATSISQTPPLGPGVTTNLCARVSVPVTATNGMTDTASVTVTSNSDPTKKATATVRTMAITFDVLLVDQDYNAPDVRPRYTAALDATGRPYNIWDIGADPNLTLNWMKAHKTIVWFTGTAYPGPILPYESKLATFLDGGGRLFMSGWDILDQAAGTTSFVRNYLHIDWDGTETQNDKPTTSVTAIPTNTVTAGFNGGNPTPVDPTVLDPSSNFSDWITPIAPAVPAFKDNNNQIDALTVVTGSYKVMFLAFPFEALGTATNRADLMNRAMSFFDVAVPATATPTASPTATASPSATPTATATPPSGNKLYLPVITKQGAGGSSQRAAPVRPSATPARR